MLKTDSLFILSRFYQQYGNLMGNSVFRGICFGKYGFSEANIYRLCRIGGGEAPATSLYGDVTDAGSAIFGDYFDVEFGAGEKWGKWVAAMIRHAATTGGLIEGLGGGSQGRERKAETVREIWRRSSSSSPEKMMWARS